ncbi:phage holin family protein [Enhygromyxa salina]|uniref:Holin-X, holin superfamily III n=1 Tax=Enhygromyxa salina TaxID=215803 RepID=A0A2S9XVP2_9BACT|nr:phage holin family protein [Enhygromyxa salina]PRP96938.1 hypothetical protein ENSA7_67690 [Enhygromyxa salina]
MPTTSKPAHPRQEGSLPSEIAHVARDVVVLRSELLKLDLLASAEKWIEPAIHKTIVAGFVGVGGLFVLIGAAMAVGVVLGHLGWGMLIVGAAVLGIGGVVAVVPPRPANADEKLAEVDADLLDSPPQLSSADTQGHDQARTLSKAELEQQIEAKEQLLGAEVDEFTDETRAQLERYAKIAAVGVAAVVMIGMIGMIARALARRGAPTDPQLSPRYRDR